ncbi:MAG TPA: hypothetical protein VM261_08435 [Kofleriaceae bacterium]|nr:hypothetical protein [Kofleriaceae bacterium]
MTRLAALVVISVTSLLACSDDTGGDVDAAVDAPTDVAIDVPDGPCGAGYQMTGEYIDWDSTSGSFMGVPATWTLTTPPGTTATGAPNGRILICLPRSTVELTATATGYVGARFLADPAVLSVSGGIFSARGLESADATARYNTISNGLTFDTAAAHVFVYKRGAATALTLTGATASYVSDGDNDTSWTAGDTGTFTLFPNVPVGITGMATLGGTFTGPTAIPLQANTFTIVPIS